METKHIHISDYNYDLPDSRIAKFPVSPRDTSKLLIYRHGEISDDIFYNLPKYLPQKSLMVFNNTKVIQARMHFRKETGALIEVFLMEPAAPTDYELMFQTRGECSWLCMVGNLKKWKEGSLVRTFDVAGSTINFKATMRRDIIDTKSGGTNYWVDFAWDNPQVSFAEILDAVGELPIPPYLNRETQDSDKTTYQTVYSKIKGSVAAPTAGLHFTDKVLAAIDAAGVRREELTLHVGAIAVGTTSVRTLESLYYMGVKLEANPDAAEEDLHVCQWEPYEKADGTPVGGNLIDGITPQKAISNIIAWLDKNNLKTLHSSTQIIIAPGYEYKIVKVLVTNFHQPQSTLLLLVSAFLKGDWRNVYDYALSHDFRFLSYGDSSILIP